MKDKGTGKYTCHARYNPLEKKWLPHKNDVHKMDNVTGVWEVDWPEVRFHLYYKYDQLVAADHLALIHNHSLNAFIIRLLCT